MTPNKRPLTVTILACLYVAVGIIGFAFHLGDFSVRHAFNLDNVWAELTEALAIVCGVFMLQGRNWARWLALAWMAFHVILSAFGALPELIVHSLFLAVFAWLLLRRPAAQYFRADGIESP